MTVISFFASLPSINPIQRLEEGSYQGVMIIEMRFVLICVSVASLYLRIIISKGMQLISKQISNTVADLFGNFFSFHPRCIYICLITILRYMLH